MNDQSPILVDTYGFTLKFALGSYYYMVILSKLADSTTSMVLNFYPCVALNSAQSQYYVIWTALQHSPLFTFQEVNIMDYTIALFITIISLVLAYSVLSNVGIMVVMLRKRYILFFSYKFHHKPLVH